MMYFLGCDGGSTKTELIIVNESGELISHHMTTGCNYSFLGYEGFEDLFKKAFTALFSKSGVAGNDITFAVMGLPTYGEIEATEKNIPEILSKFLPIDRLRIVNDSVAAWGGSLAAQPGINIASGTGSIAFGVDPQGGEKRVGGWSLLFCDEGSCSWIGRQVLEIFTMQSDGRLPRTELYELVKKHYALTKKDQYFSELISLIPVHSALLGDMQLIALEAYQEGDQKIARLYEKAAEYLVEMALAIRSHLAFPEEEPIQVSYSGGLFKSGEIVLKPFIHMLRRNNFSPIDPKYSPIIGSIALAASPFLPPERLDVMLKNIYFAYNKQIINIS